MKQFRFTAFVLFAAMFLALGLVVALQQENEEAIENLTQQYEERYNAGDAAGMAELWTVDSVQRVPFGQVHEGRVAIQQHYQGLMDAGITGMSLEIIEVQVLNGTAYVIGSHSAMDAEGEPAGGYFMAIYTRENNEWRFHRSVANMVMPEPEMNDGSN